MRSGHLWLKVLNVHVNEWRVVKKLFWLQFFQGAGISFFFTAEFARFLERMPVYELPWVMVMAAFLLWLTGLLYTILEHRIPFRKFNGGIILLMAGSMLLVRVGSNFFPGIWFYYFSLAWFYVLYLLNNLEFWGIAARLFDMRQSKRLFGVISAGDIPAKFIGYTLALVFVPYTGTLNLLLIGFVCMLLSLPFFNTIAREEEKAFASGHPAKNIHHSGTPINNLLADFRNSRIIRSIALISLLASACMIIVNYGLYSKVKEEYSTDVELARFIAMFMAGLRIAALITKTILTGRLTTVLGVRQSLFITPAVMIVLISTLLFVNWTNPDQKILFYFFGATSIAVDVLRTSINSPVLLTVMQPLPTHERLRAHNIVKGIMDPFATLLCGILLLVLFRIQHEINLITICYILVGLAVCWIGGIVMVNRDYLSMLIKTISSRFFSQEEFTLNDPDIIAQIRRKIETGSASEVLSVLNMVGTKQNPISIELLSCFLDHSSEQVKLEALRLIAAKKIVSLKDKLSTLVLESREESVRNEAIKTICQLAENNHELQAYLSNPDPALRLSAIKGMLCNRMDIAKSMAEDALRDMIGAGSTYERFSAMHILDEVKDEYDHPEHRVLIEHNDDHTAIRAINAIGNAAAPTTLSAAMNKLVRHRPIVMKALHRAGSRSIPFIATALEESHYTIDIRNQLIVLCGKIGGTKSHDVLVRMLKNHPSGSAAIIQALYRSRYQANKENRHYFESLARAYIRFAVELLHMQKALTGIDQPSALLYNAIQIEFQEIREILLSLFACIYDREKVRKARNGFYTHNRDSIANAMEIIELTVKKDLARYFNTLFENTSIEHRCEALRFLYTETEYRKTNQVLGRILSEKPILYHDWTKACSMYVSKKYLVTIDVTLMDKYLNAENPLLKETAHYVCT
ncbi:MFS transporter [Flavihumibacter solisilvae]|uniref:ADP,ATP carrier protein n=1 Tax=Flavihumibacter solisilvae TaxID=1349421 RepID=A0A0C1IYJ0_9BACT|nr:MFS transporter [Flavihumibacter solisilvae]KIC95534.1 hypothetical protein OI18_04515 [Flavihumibacter solisilvae]